MRSAHIFFGAFLGLVAIVGTSCKEDDTSTTPAQPAGTATASGGGSSSSSGGGADATCVKPTPSGTDYNSCIDDCRKCETDPKCDRVANPPSCQGGKLIIRCSGSCRPSAAQPSITCRAGLCEASCTGDCDGTKNGDKCEGKCTGTCSGSCKAPPDGTVECDGACDGDFEVVCCEGGVMKSSCPIDAACEAKCQPKAQCK